MRLKPFVLDGFFNVNMESFFTYLILFVSQIGNSYCRSWNIKAISNGKAWEARISWFLYGVMFLSSLSIGIKSVWEYDFIGIIIWFVSSHIGLEFGMIEKWKKKKH